MNSKNELLKKLEVQYKVEELSNNNYSLYLQKFSDKKILDAIAQIRDQEITHMKVVKEAIELVKGYNKVIKEISKKPRLDMNKILSAGTILLEGHVDSYFNHLTDIIGALLPKNEIIYIAYEKTPTYIQNTLRDKKIDMTKIKLINCSSTEAKGFISIQPEDLTQLSITLTETAKRMKTPVVIVDAITGFPIFHPQEKIMRFVSAINGKAHAGQFKEMIWISIENDGQKQLIDSLAAICDLHTQF
jgi:hypothetical protein